MRKGEGVMSIFLNIIAILLILSGIIHCYNALTNRVNSAYYKFGKVKIPLWVCKMGASLFIIVLGIYLIIT